MHRLQQKANEQRGPLARNVRFFKEPTSFPQENRASKPHDEADHLHILPIMIFKLLDIDSPQKTL